MGNDLVSVRLEDDLREAVDLVAEVENMPFSGVVRLALQAYVAERKKDPEFRSKAEAHLARLRQKLLD